MNGIFTTLLYEMEKRHDTVLCTIIADNGSTPRGRGAQMLVGEKGLLCGTIGGGAVEGSAIRLGQALLQERRSTIHEYRLRHNNAEDIGMVCGGDVTVHLQFIPADDPAWRALAGDVLHRIALRQPGWLALALDGGAPALLSAADTDDAHIALPLPIGERAIIFGAGHCSLALCPLLTTVGFRVTVVDERPELVTKERFPSADAVVCCDLDRLADALSIGGEDYVVVMTNGHSHDFSVQQQVLRGQYAYIGVIGSRAKTASVNARLREAGISEAAIAAVHTPIGTAIKAVTPEEIAVSIAGEMICVRATRREAAGVKLRGCPMH